MILKQYNVRRKEEHILDGQLLQLVVDIIKEKKETKEEKEAFILTLTPGAFWKMCAEPTRKEISLFKNFWNIRKSIAVIFYNSLDKMEGYIVFTAILKDETFSEFIIEEIRIGAETIYKYPDEEEVINDVIM